MTQSSVSTMPAGHTLVPNSPAYKRQKTPGGGYHSTSTGYNSEADSGDEIFDDIVETPPSKHYTQPTQILNQHVTQPTQLIRPVGTQPTQIISQNGTQPTQIFNRSSYPSSPLRQPSSPVNLVQVPASSPFRQERTSTAGLLRLVAPQGGRAASLMAPAGTAFRNPNQRPVAQTLPQKKQTYIDLSDDDGPKYGGGSSDDDGVSRGEIKPSSFKAKTSNSSFGASITTPTISSNTNFQELMVKSMFDPGQPKKRVFDLTGSGYDSKNRNSNVKATAQTRPERAMPVSDLSEWDIPDDQLRRKIIRLRGINPQWTVSACRDVLEKCKGSIDDASVLLFEDIHEISDDESQLPSIATIIPQTMKHTTNVTKSIAQRYTSTQGTKKPTQLQEATPPKKTGRRLVKGRRHSSSPTAEPILATDSSMKAKIAAKEPGYESEMNSNDSGVASESEEDPELEDRVLRYLNTCTAEDLAEFVSTKIENAELIVAGRPFRKLHNVRNVAAPTKSGKRSTKAPMGDKIVDDALKMQAGYEAVDVLVEECKKVGKPLAEAISSWEFDVYGHKKGDSNGGQALSAQSEDGSMKDSGLGTPTSKDISRSAGLDDEDVLLVASRAKRTKFIDQPSMMANDFHLKDFQRVGVNWLALLYKHELSCILADEMGCGKTAQVISFLAYLTESGINPGPHLVVVPPSTLENWLREFQRFCPDLLVQPYYGSEAERIDLATGIIEGPDKVNVVITTYSFAEKPHDQKFLRRLQSNVCVYDEGHMLKNNQTIRYKNMMRIPAKFRILLTGTPLQNNLLELASLLNFILPDIFSEHAMDIAYVFKHKATTSATSHAALLNKERIARAKSMLSPFILQRKADVVLKDLPPKTNRVEYCELENSQAIVYNGLRDKALEAATARKEGIKIPFDKNAENNPMVQARKAALHPMLFRRHFEDKKLEEMMKILKKHVPAEFKGERHHIMAEMKAFSDFRLHKWCQIYPCIAKFDVPRDTCMNSGKVHALVRLLKQYKADGDRVLVFSQFVLMLEILEEVLEVSGIHFCRIDGSTSVNERQAIIDTFRNDTSITAFLLSTGAGGTGINLEMANKVIIFDSSFNPHDDVQAEKRAHRMGQTRPVEVVRMVTKDTIEEQIHALGQMKLALDQKVTGLNEAPEADSDETTEKTILKMMLEGTKAEDGFGVDNTTEKPALAARPKLE